MDLLNNLLVLQPMLQAFVPKNDLNICQLLLNGGSAVLRQQYSS